MNKIYRTVYNETTGTWVAVCEIAKTHTKSSGSTVDNATASVSGSLKARSLTAIAASLALLSPLAVSPAFAANPNGTMHPNTQIGSSDGDENVNTVTGSADTVWGTHNTVSNNSTAFGQSNTATGDKSTAFGNSNHALGNQSTAFGVDNIATGANSTAFGQRNTAGYFETDVASLQQMGITTVEDFCKAIGAPDAVWCTKQPTLEAARQASIGFQVDDEAGLATLLGVGGVSGAKNATAWGLNNLAGNKQATAFGENSIANGVNSTAFGLNSYAYADNSLAALGGQVGLDSQGANNTAHSTTGLNSVAIGEKAWVRSDNAFAFGKESLIDTGSANSVAIGSFSKVGPNATNSFAAVGGQAHNNNTIAIGVRSEAYGEGSLALGSGITSGNTAGAYSKGEGSIAIGKRAEALGAKVNYDNDGKKGELTLPQLSNEERQKLGLADPTGHEYSYNRTEDSAYASQMIAIGDNAGAYGNQSIAIGGNSVASGYAAIAIGGDDLGNAAGSNKVVTDYLKGELYNDLENGEFVIPSTIDNIVAATKQGGDPKKMWVNLTTAKGSVSTAFGIKAVAEGDLSNAYGTAARSAGKNSNAFGTVSYAGGDESIAFGTAAETGNDANRSVALGYMSQVQGEDSAAVGQKNKIAKNNTFVLGNNVNGDLENSVYLGAGSTTKAQGGAAVTDFVNSAIVGGITYGGFKGQTVQLDQDGEAVIDAQGNTQVVGGIVSVGSAGKERRIKNVAAGRIGPNSTDAINGSQLYAVLPEYTDDGKGNATSVTVGNKTYNLGNKQQPVVYTDKEGNKLTQVGGKWYKTADIGADGKPTPNAKAVDLGDVVASMNTGGNSTINPMSLNNVASHLAPVDSTYNAGSDYTTSAPSGILNTPVAVEEARNKNDSILSQAATVGDVINAGWNLQTNGSALDFVTHADTVNFKSSDNTIKVTGKYTEDNISEIDLKANISFLKDNGEGGTTTAESGDTAIAVKLGDNTYNLGGGADGNDNTVTELTVNDGNAPGNTTGNLKLTDKGENGNHKYDVSLNNVVTVGDTSDTSKDKPVTIDGSQGTINFTKDDGSVTGLSQHFTKTGDTTAPKETADTTSGKADNQAATVGDVKNVGWNLKVGGGDKVKDFINHGDTVNFGNGKGTTAQFAKDAKTGETTISFDIAKAGDSKVDTEVTNADAGKVTGGTANQYWDSNQVQNAINDAGWKVGVGAKANDKDELINAGDRVGLVAGQGVSITQKGSNFTIATDYVFKDGTGDDITSKGGSVATITTKNDKGEDVTYNFGDGNDNTVTAVTVNGGQDAAKNKADGGNLKLTATKDDKGNPTYDIALSDEIDLTDSGSLKVGGDDIANGSSVTNITAGKIDFGDTQGSITNVASHLKDPASEDDKGQVINPDNAPANFNSVKNEAATVGDVLNAGWNLKVGGQDADFVQHGDTVAFGNGTGTTAKYDAKNGVISFDITKANNPIIPAVGEPNAGKVTGGKANQYWDSTQVQTAINNVGWFVNSGAVNGKGTNSGAASTLVNAGQEVKFIAGEGMNIVQNGKELTFNVKIKDNNNTPLKIDTDGYYVVNGGSGTGGGTGTGGGWTVVDPNNPKNFDINGGGQDVEFVGDVNTNVKVERPKQSGDPVGIQVGLNDTVYVGGTDDGTANGKPNAGSVTIDGTPNGNSITFNQDNPAHNVTVGTDGQGNLKVGDTNGAPTKIVNVAPGENREDAVDVGQLVDTVGAANTTPATNSKGTQLNVVQTTTQPIDENGNPVGNPQEYTLKTYNVKDQGEYLTNNVVEAVSKMNEQGIKFFHTNEDENFVPTAQDHNQVDSSASGGLSTAIGVQAKATGKQAIVVGNKSEANGVQSIAVGTQVVVNGDHSGGIGDPTIINGSNSYSVGNNNIVATDNTFVLGNNVTKTAENSVFLGNFAGTDVAGAGATGTVSNATLGGVTYGNFAGAKADGLVAVGGNGQVRRVSGVAAGEISATSTDAINGSQLYFALPDYVNGNGTTVEIGDAKDPITGDPTGRKTVSINIVPGYSAGLEAGNNVELETKPVLDQDGNQLYIDSSGNSTTAATDPTGTPNKRQETTVIHAKQPDLRPIEQHVQQVENNAYAGVAQAMATAGLPQAYLPGKSMVAISGGHYKGEQGYALGLSSISDSGNWVFKATASGNSRGNVGGTIGAGYQW